MNRAVRVTVAAALLGLGWFPVLLVPPWTRAWLLSDRRMIAGNAALLVAASVIIAWVFRDTIARATTPREHWMRAAVLPYAGCLIYLTLWNAMGAARTLARGHGVNVHDALVLYPWGLWHAMAACFVVIPYGLLCQHVMQKAQAAEPDPGDARRAA